MDHCEEILELLSARLDGPLTAEEERFLESHLDGCPPCRALADDLAALHAVMPDLEEAPPPGMKEAVMARIKAEVGEPIPFPVKRAPVRRWQTWGAAAAVVLLVAAGAFGLPGGMGGGTGQSSRIFGGAPEAQPPSPSSAPSAALRKENAGAVAPQGEEGLVHSIEKAAGDAPLEPPSAQLQPAESVQPFLSIAAVLTPEQAAQRLCDEVLGEEPQEESWDEEGFTGCLLPGGWSVSYLGLSEDGMAHEFQVYVGAEDGRRYAVPLDGSEIYLLSGAENK